MVKDLFWSSFGIGEIDAPTIPQNLQIYNNLNSTDHRRLHEMFLKLSEQTVAVGYLLYGAYLMITAVVLVNMLIAIMSKTFDTIYNDREAEWKFMRASLWMKYYEPYNVLPVPFNIIEYFIEVCLWLVRLCCKVRVGSGDQIERGHVNSRERKEIYYRVCKRLVQRLRQSDGYDAYSQKYSHDPLGLIARGVMTVVDEQRQGANVVKNGLNRLETAICRLAKSKQNTGAQAPKLHIGSRNLTVIPES